MRAKNELGLDLFFPWPLVYAYGTSETSDQGGIKGQGL